MPTAQDYQSEIAFELGMASPGGPAQDPETTQLVAALSTQLPTLWAMAAAEPSLPLRFLVTKRRAAAYLVGQLRTKVAVSLGPLSQQLQQLWEHARAIYEETASEIIEARKQLAAGRGPVMAPLLRRAPVDPGVPRHVPAEGEPTRRVPIYNDPSDPRYGGLPLPGRFRRRF
jgi:hypothetical protein